MAIPTMHFRKYGTRTQNRLQQLFVFEDGDTYLLERYALTDTTATGSPMSEWLETISHEWRNVPFVEQP